MLEPAEYHVEWRQTHDAAGGPFGSHYPVRLRDGSSLELPLQPLPDGAGAIALLMSNQTSFRVEEKICERLADLVRPLGADAVVGIPTLGLTYARSVAERLGLTEYVAMGLSRKFWYDDRVSQPVTSSTSPDQAKRIYLDPALMPRVRGRRVVLIDDVLNTGRTTAAAVRLLRHAQAQLVGIAVVLSEGWSWRAELARIDPNLVEAVFTLGHIPMFGRTDAGWMPLAGTDIGGRPAAAPGPD